MESINMMLMRNNHSRDLKLRKAIYALFRYHSRQMSKRFSQWKYKSIYEKEFQV